MSSALKMPCTQQVQSELQTDKLITLNLTHQPEKVKTNNYNDWEKWREKIPRDIMILDWKTIHYTKKFSCILNINQTKISMECLKCIKGNNFKKSQDILQKRKKIAKPSLKEPAENTTRRQVRWGPCTLWWLLGVLEAGQWDCREMEGLPPSISFTSLALTVIFTRRRALRGPHELSYSSLNLQHLRGTGT